MIDITGVAAVAAVTGAATGTADSTRQVEAAARRARSDDRPIMGQSLGPVAAAVLTAVYTIVVRDQSEPARPAVAASESDLPSGDRRPPDAIGRGLAAPAPTAPTARTSRRAGATGAKTGSSRSTSPSRSGQR